MKKVGKVLLWIFAVFGFLIFLTIIIIASSFPAKKKVDIKPNSWLELTLEGEHHDYNVYKNVMFFQEDASISEMCRKIDKAKNDDKIKGILLKPEFFTTGWAFTQELRQHLQQFQKAGKKVVSHIDMTGDRGYYIASVSDKIYLNPSVSAGLALTGIGAEINYYKGFLDKIGIEFTVLHQGKYKGTGEIMARKNMSDPMRESLSAVFDDLYSAYTEGCATSRNLTRKEFREVMEDREEYLISSHKAIEYGLVDDLLQGQEVNEKALNNDPVVDFADYSESVSGVMADKVAILYAQGNIVRNDQRRFLNGDYRSITEKKISQQLDIINKMESVKALVLRLNSGGGSDLVSKNILNRLEEINKKMPLVVSMGSVAASGGYMISSHADYIVAEPTTLTGSIGVVALLPNWQELREKADINTETIYKGKFAGFLSPNFTPTSEEIKSLNMELEKVYDSFKNIVHEGRDMSMQKVETIAQGRIWSGQDAVRYGLVDTLGGLTTAVKKAAALAQMKDYSELILPQPKTLLDLIMEGNGPFQIMSKLNLFSLLEESLLFEIWQKEPLLKNFLEDPIQTILPYDLQIN
ncbi:MAG: signal peptide peptidase SppA [Candidatus Cloacimonetes bacterium]|nr:signal peptide peptidase SppA [Candidatus Cloacimonadota bacterium]